MRRGSSLGISVLAIALSVPFGGRGASAQCDSLTIFPAHTGNQDAAHVGVTSDDQWLPCAPTDPDGVNWIWHFNIPFACNNLSCLRMMSSGGDHSTSEVRVDGSTVGFLPTNPGPDCDFELSEFATPLLNPGKHTITVRSNGGPDFAFHDVRLVCAAGTTLVCPEETTVYLPAAADSFDVSVSIIGTTAELSTFGLHAVFDSTRLEFRSVAPGNWDCFVGVADAADSIRIEGCAAPPRAVVPPDNVAILSFTSPDPFTMGPDSIRTTAYTGDFVGLAECTGTVNYVPCGHGDVDGSGNLSMTDALCAHRCNLEFGIMPADCLFPGIDCERNAADVNCDGSCLAADALWIAQGSLCQHPPIHCDGVNPACPPGPGREVAVARIDQVRAGAVEIKRGQTARIPIEMRGSGTLRSFHVDLSVPEGLQVLSLERADATRRWPGLDIGQRPGIVRIAGFDLDGVALDGGEWVTIASLEVHAGTDVPAEFSFGLVDLSPELAGAQLVETPIRVLGQVDELPVDFTMREPRPNPSSGAVSVDFLVPVGPTRPVEIRVYNVSGRVVRTVSSGVRAAGEHTVAWDGRDDAGHLVAPGAYFISMRSTDFHATRKVVQTR